MSREKLDDTLNHCDIDVVAGTDLFRLVNVSNAEDCWLKLAECGIYVRRFDGGKVLFKIRRLPLRFLVHLRPYQLPQARMPL